jgi:hypothetical protein
MLARSALPRSLRALLALDRAASELAGAAHVLRDELACALIAPGDREALTLSLYAAQATYAPGGVAYEAGLFAWERAALSAPPFVPGSTLLLGGAGGGREIAGLAGLGFSVLAFEPCAALAAEAAGVAHALSRGDGQALVVQASYDDLVDHAAGAPGPLSALLASRRPDAAVLGWTSIAHVLTAERQVAVLKAVASATGRGPVLLSFLLASGESPRPARLRRRLRAALGRPAGSHLVFSPQAGFLRLTSAEELASLAEQAGYAVCSFAAEPYPHAVLVAPSPAAAEPPSLSSTRRGPDRTG